MKIANDKPRICVATVAYNNPEELSALFESIARQTRPIDGLIVIDNSEKIDFIDSNKRIFNSLLPDVSYKKYIAMDKNRGSAHGFKKGMEIAHANGFDWVWLLDQDGIADEKCLKFLAEVANEADVLCPKVLAIEDGSSELTFRSNINFWGDFVPIFVGKTTEHRVMTVFATHGVMISRLAIDKTGYFDDKNFFCGWEDHDYSLRLKEHNCSMILIPEAVVYHPDLAVKYKKIKPTKLAITSRAFLFINSICTLPPFLGTATNEGTELEEIRRKTRLVLFRKYVRGFRFWVTILFSMFCLSMMKVTGRKVSFLDSFVMYLELVRYNPREDE
ncbi:MAG: glycosyltransferase family 2 protein [Synergistaceae bacterium]|jgi:GT2 family glycosyltransferase|nr:glycosyltransferase family 2 protein [Synergistaceae bacterium]